MAGAAVQTWANSGAAPQVVKRRRSKAVRTLMRVGWNLLPPLTFIAIVALWAAAIPVFKIPPYLLPAPGGVFGRIVSDASQLWSNALVTLTEIGLGFGLTLLTAIPLGLVIALSPLSRQILYPPLMLLQVERSVNCKNPSSST